MKIKCVLFFVSVVAILSLTGCATTADPATTPVATATGTLAVPSKLVSTGYEIENFLQEFNTGLQAAAPGVESFLEQTHNGGDAQTVALYSSLASAFAATTSAALKAGLPAPQVQAAANVALAPPAAAAAAAAVVSVTPATN